MVKKSKSTLLKNKLFKLWAQIIHLGGQCELCGRSHGKLDAHHLEGRTGSLKYDLENGMLLCFTCHRRGVHNEASSVQAEFRQKIIFLRGEEAMDRLKRKRYKIVKHTIGELEALLEAYKQLSDDLTNN